MKILLIISYYVLDTWEEYLPKPPDGGWGWIVVFASFVIHFVTEGIPQSFGLLLEEYVEYFGSNVAEISLASSLNIGIGILFGTFALILFLTANLQTFDRVMPFLRHKHVVITFSLTADMFQMS